MIGKKINQLATELAPVSTDLTIIGDPVSGVSKKITLAQLGAIFSGAVSFYTNFAAFPTPGTTDVIYCAKDTQKLYLWSGSAYVEVFPSQALLDTYQLRSEKGNANGYASLDSGGKVPISQLPSSIMEYKGTWNASTNTPTLANGTGDTGDVYICNVAGTVNFGAGPITFAVGDYVIYSGTIWQRSSGAVGTVTSVALTVGGDAISVSGSPLTTSGTLALAFSGTTSQYIRGNGTLANFPTSLVTGTGTTNRVTKWSSTSGEIINSGIVDIGGSIYNTLTTPGQFAWQFNGDTSTGLSNGALIVAGTNSSDIALRIENASSTSVYFYVWGDGRVQINNIPNATTDTDRFLVSDSGVIKYRTGAELLSDIGGASASGYVPYTGATANLDLGTHTLIAAKGTFSSSGSGTTVGITHSSGSGIALNITKGGNGEGLYINKTSGSGNAATIIGTLNATTLVKSGGTSSQFLKADGSVDSTSYGTGSVTSVGLSSATSGISIFSTPITTSGTITIDISTASGSGQGLLSSTDWTTFNNKQNALTNPVTGTGTTNYLPKFTGASTIGDSAVSDNGTTVTLNSRALSGTSATFVSTSATNNAARYNLSIGDNSSVAAGNGGGILFRGVYTGTTLVDAAAISSYKANGTDGDYGYGLSFVTRANGGDLTSRLIIDPSGNLGLGVTPSAWGSTLRVIEIGGPENGYLAFNPTNLQSYIYWNAYYDTDNRYKKSSQNAAAFGVTSSGSYAWYTAPSGTAGNAISFTQAMTLDASGRLGIGTTSPGGKLHISSVGDMLRLEGAVSNANYMSFYEGATRLGYFGRGSGGSFDWYISNEKAAAIIFETNANTERMRITSGGNVLVGTTSLPSASVSGFCITGNSSGNISSSGASTSAYNHLLFYNGNGLVGYISTSGSTTTYSTSSDYRLKQDLKDFNGLDLLTKIKTYDYEWKSDKTRSYGVIAHELQSVINYAVTGVKDGEQMQGVDYSKIVPVLIKSIQELKQELDTLKNK
jgi:hypothetical protein